MATIDLSGIVNLIQQLLPLVVIFAILPLIFSLFKRLGE